MKKSFLPILFFLTLAGCAGKVSYHPPSGIQSASNTIIVEKSKNEVWKEIIPSLGSSFFVINNLDKESGFINVSYSGSPESFVDCGYIESYVQNARGKRNYKFPAATAYKEYETFEGGKQLIFIKRKMKLEGRINIVLQSLDVKKTLITINTKYAVTKSGVMSDVQGRTQSFNDTISFNTNGNASFPQQTACYATGKLEQKVLKSLGL